MKNILLKIVSFVLCAVMVLSFAGCTEQKEYPNILDEFETKMLTSDTTIENDKLSLKWDAANKCVIFIDKQTGAQWTTSPYGYLENPNKLAMQKKFLQSPIHIKYEENYSFADGTSPDPGDEYGYTAMRDSNVKVEKKDDGFVISFCFEKANAVVPLCYTLKEDCLAISINTNDIIENEDPLHSITVLPTFCSVKKGTENSYMFYPSGTGALIDTSNPNASDVSYTAGVYGNDAARKVKDKLTNDKNIYMPVFGTVIGDNAICGIITSGAESSKITYNSNYSRTDYSVIYPELTLRGADFNTIKGSGNRQETEIFADEMLRDSLFEIEFYPLSGEQANYNGMAKLYQNKLYGNNEGTNIKEDVYSLKVYGGLLEQNDVLGFPYKSLLALTTYDDVNNMLNELSATGVTPNVQLYGFGGTGLDIEKVAGGFKLGKAFGNKKQLQSLMDYCSTNSIDIFADFDVINFKTNSVGYNTSFDAAKTANRQAAFQYYISKTVQTQDTTENDRFRLLKRDKVLKAANTLLKKIGKYNLTGVSFASLSSTAYSDYTSSKYFAKKDMPSYVTGIMEQYKNSGYNVAANGANAYAAKAADCVFETPISSSELDVFWTDVPFYQMVFKGKTEITSEAVNAGEALNIKQLRALETGSSMLFYVYKNYSSVLTYSPHKMLYGALYEDVKEDIIKTAANYSDYYAAISGQTIANHQLITNDVRCTTFSNGVKIYVNYSGTDYTVADGTVKAGGCLIIK